MIRHKILDVWVKKDNPASQSVEFFVGLYGDKPIEIMKNDLNILERNNKIFKFKPY